MDVLPPLLLVETAALLLDRPAIQSGLFILTGIGIKHALDVWQGKRTNSTTRDNSISAAIVEERMKLLEARAEFEKNVSTQLTDLTSENTRIRGINDRLQDSLSRSQKDLADLRVEFAKLNVQVIMLNNQILHGIVIPVVSPSTTTETHTKTSTDTTTTSTSSPNDPPPS